MPSGGIPSSDSAGRAGPRGGKSRFPPAEKRGSLLVISCPALSRPGSLSRLAVWHSGSGPEYRWPCPYRLGADQLREVIGSSDPHRSSEEGLVGSNFLPSTGSYLPFGSPSALKMPVCAARCSYVHALPGLLFSSKLAGGPGIPGFAFLDLLFWEGRPPLLPRTPAGASLLSREQAGEMKQV